MAELDYAFVADFARVESGKLTAVGASYSQVSVEAFPATHFFAIAGRVRAAADTAPIDLRIIVRPPADGPTVIMRGTMTPESGPIAYDGKIGVVFAVTNILLIAGPGLVEIFIEIDGEQQRRLAFDVQQV